jgi:hypothetical protein
MPAEVQNFVFTAVVIWAAFAWTAAGQPPDKPTCTGPVTGLPCTRGPVGEQHFDEEYDSFPFGKSAVVALYAANENLSFSDRKSGTFNSPSIAGIASGTVETYIGRYHGVRLIFASGRLHSIVLSWDWFSMNGDLDAPDYLRRVLGSYLTLVGLHFRAEGKFLASLGAFVTDTPVAARGFWSIGTKTITDRLCTGCPGAEIRWSEQYPTKYVQFLHVKWKGGNAETK